MKEKPPETPRRRNTIGKPCRFRPAHGNLWPVDAWEPPNA